MRSQTNGYRKKRFCILLEAKSLPWVIHFILANLAKIGLFLAAASYFCWPCTLFSRITINIVLPGGHFLHNAQGVGAAGDNSAR